MSQVSFPITSFVDTDGNPVDGGHVLINLSEDAYSPSGQICGGITTKVTLNSTGTMSSIPQVWQNSSLVPSDSAYVVNVYSREGQLVYGPMLVTA